MSRVGEVENGVARRTGSDPRRTPWYWLLTTRTFQGLGFLMEMAPKGEVIVPVFGSEGAAHAYLSEGVSAWKPRKTSRGELASVLMGLCKDAGWVALDPAPGATGKGAAGLRVSSREAFLERLLGTDGRGKTGTLPAALHPKGARRRRSGSKLLSGGLMDLGLPAQGFPLRDFPPHGSAGPPTRAPRAARTAADGPGAGAQSMRNGTTGTQRVQDTEETPRSEGSLDGAGVGSAASPVSSGAEPGTRGGTRT